jgi:hypothetical protein
MNTRLIVVCAVLAVFANAIFPAQAGIMDFFFPQNRPPDPSKTLVAPFAEPPAETTAAQPGANPGLPENSTPLDYAHRPNVQIGQWATIAVSEALTFDKDDYQQEIEEHAQHFEATGKQQYITFLQDNSLIRVLETHKFHVRGFVQEAPLLLNEGAVDGSYRWLFQVPVMVSYMDRNMKNYKNKTAEPVNQLITLTIQVGRAKDLTPGKDIAIERWSGRVQAIKK